MRAEGPNHYPYILGMALNHYKIKPKVSICFRLQQSLENRQFNINKNKEGCIANYSPLGIFIFLSKKSKTLYRI